MLEDTVILTDALIIGAFFKREFLHTIEIRFFIAVKVMSRSWRGHRLWNIRNFLYPKKECYGEGVPDIKDDLNFRVYFPALKYPKLQLTHFQKHSLMPRKQGLEHSRESSSDAGISVWTQCISRIRRLGHWEISRISFGAPNFQSTSPNQQGNGWMNQTRNESINEPGSQSTNDVTLWRTREGERCMVRERGDIESGSYMECHIPTSGSKNERSIVSNAKREVCVSNWDKL